MSVWDFEALAVGRLGIPPSDFWKLSPARLDLIVEQFEARERAADRRAALVTAAVMNSRRDPKRRPFAVEDFMPKRSAARRAPQSVEEQLRVMGAWARITKA